MTTLLKTQRIIGAILLAGLGLFAPISSASAHTDLVSTSPAADSDVNASQESISLTFAEPTLVDGAAIVVTNSNGDILDSPAPTLDGSTLSIPWPMDLTPGQVKIEWRATGDDGHVLSGDFGFNYTAAAEGGMAPSSTVSASPSESAEPMLTVEASDEGTTIELPRRDRSNTILVIAIVSLLGLVVAGMFLRRGK